MNPLRRLASALLRVWSVLVVVTTVAGAGTGLFGLYTILVVKAPVTWFDQMVDRPVDWQFLGWFVVAWVAMGIIMFRFGRRVLREIAEERK